MTIGATVPGNNGRLYSGMMSEEDGGGDDGFGGEGDSVDWYRRPPRKGRPSW
jgi:hypothetical protein